MKRNLLLIAAVALSLCLVGQRSEGRWGQPCGITAGPYLMFSTQTTQAVMWETARKCTSEVLYGTETPLTMSATAEGLTQIHDVTIKGLEPETKYFYQTVSRCGGRELKSEMLTFQTAVRPDSAFSFAVMSDNQQRPRIWHRIAKRIWAERPNFVLDCGDVVSNGPQRWQWRRQFLAPAHMLMSRIPLFISIGNHERNSHWFYDYVSYPAPEDYYSFDYGNAHFVMVDSNQDLAPGSEEYDWIEKDLAASNATWKFVAHHHPPYSSDEDDYGDTYKEPSTLGDLKVRQLVPLYEKYGVDIVWVGHVHTYERTWPIRDGKVDPEGVIYIRPSSSGGTLEDHAPTRSWFTAKLLRANNYCTVDIFQNTLTMHAYDIDGVMFDYLKIEK